MAVAGEEARADDQVGVLEFERVEDLGEVLAAGLASIGSAGVGGRGFRALGAWSQMLVQDWLIAP